MAQQKVVDLYRFAWALAQPQAQWASLSPASTPTNDALAAWLLGWHAPEQKKSPHGGQSG
jgi:hypothetical protein